MNKVIGFFGLILLIVSAASHAQQTQFAEQEYGIEAAVLNSVPTTPSYPCTGKLNNVETLVCNSTELAVADNLMVMAYKKQMEQTPDEQKPELKKAQLQWLKERNQCETAECVLQKTQSRATAFSVADTKTLISAIGKIKLRESLASGKSNTSGKTPVEFFQVSGGRMCLYGHEKLKCTLLNDRGLEETPTPTHVEGFKKLAMTNANICILTDKSLNCYGWCKGGKVCDVPAAFKNGKNVTDIAVGQRQVCVIKSGKVECWGDDDSFRDDVPKDLDKPKAIFAGGDSVCALMGVNQARCWGDSQVGINNIPALDAPIKSMDVGDLHACALLANETVICWGGGRSQELVKPEDRTTNSPPINNNFKSISVGDGANCGMRNSGVMCWGRQRVIKEFPLADIPKDSKIKVGEAHLCALYDNEVNCWGEYEAPSSRYEKLPSSKPITLD